MLKVRYSTIYLCSRHPQCTEPPWTKFVLRGTSRSSPPIALIGLFVIRLPVEVNCSEKLHVSGVLLQENARRKNWSVLCEPCFKKGGGGKKSDIVAGCGNKRAMVMRDHWPQCMPEFMYDMPQNMKVLSHMST